MNFAKGTVPMQVGVGWPRSCLERSAVSLCFLFSPWLFRNLEKKSSSMALEVRNAFYRTKS